MKSKASLFFLLSVSVGLSLTPSLAQSQKPEGTASFVQGVSVLGEVQKPGVYPVTGELRLFDVLSLAGGTTPKAGQIVTITHGDQAKSVHSVALSNDPQKNSEANVEITPGDTVVVSKAAVVYVVGDVRKPMGVVIENSDHITVLRALAAAEGVNPTASLRNAKIIRKGDNGPTEIPLDLRKIMQAKAPDVPLQADDILFVPAGAAKSQKEKLYPILQFYDVPPSGPLDSPTPIYIR